MKEKILKLKEILTGYEKLSENKKNVDELLEAFEEFKIPIVLIGEFSAGKSSLINSLLQEDLLDVDTTPTTAKPYEIYYSKTENKYVKDGVEVLELSNQNLKHYKNLKIVDLPGISSQYFDHTNVAKDYLARKDSIFAVVVGTSKGSISEEVLNFVRNLKDFQKEFIFILSKKDKVAKEDADKVLQTNLAVLRETYKSPAYYCMVSASNDEISSFADILSKYEFRFDEIRNEMFSVPFKNIVTQIKLSLENIRNLEKAESEITLEKIDMAIKEIEDQLPYLEEQKNMEINQLTESVKDEYDNLFSEISNYIYSNLEDYIENPSQMSQDINSFIKSKQQSVDAEISRIFNEAISNLNNNFAQLETINFFDNILSKGINIIGNNKVGKIILTTIATGDILAAGAETLGIIGGIGEATVTGTELATTAGGATAVGAEAATGVASSALGIAMPVIGIVGMFIVHNLLSNFKRKKVKENIETILNQIRKELDSNVVKLTRGAANKIANEYMSKIRSVKNDLSQLRLQKLNQASEKQKIINAMETDIKTLESFLA